MGLHDALDGFITFQEAQCAIAKIPTDTEVTDLSPAIESLFALCQEGDWMTDDPLGLGGLLFDACRLCRLIGEERLGDVRLLEKILDASGIGIKALLASRYLNRPVAYRLAFRELGLAIGLRALPTIVDTTKKGRSGFERTPALRQAVDLLLRYNSLCDEIVSAWLPHAQHHDENWQAHQDINEVMLATALIPSTFLSVGEKAVP
jgi:hypothetical protein